MEEVYEMELDIITYEYEKSYGEAKQYNIQTGFVEENGVISEGKFEEDVKKKDKFCLLKNVENNPWGDFWKYSEGSKLFTTKFMQKY